LDFLAAAGQSLWQVLPLGPTGYGDSPYQCFSAFAGNPLLISPQLLVQHGLLEAADIEQVPRMSSERVNFCRVIDYKRVLLEKAFGTCATGKDAGMRVDFLSFSESAASWLEDYALFRALKQAHNGAAWNTWAPELIKRDARALASARDALRDKIESEK